MKYSIVLTKKDYTKFETAYNKKMPFTCKGFNIKLIVCSNNEELFSITNGIKEIYISVEVIETSLFGTISIIGDNCIIKIHESKPIDITTKISNGTFIKPKKSEKIFSFTFK